MHTKNLPIIRANAEFYISNKLAALQSNKINYEQLLEICNNYRQIGICTLFIEYSAQSLFDNLIKSSKAFLYGITNIHKSQVTTSKALPLFDAIACNDYRLAQKISTALSREHNPEEEYLDEFLYFSFLMQRFFLNGNEQSCNDLLVRYEDLLDGTTDEQFVICKALNNKDKALFDDGLEQLIIKNSNKYKQGFLNGSILEEEYATNGCIFIEGLALIRLANTIGITTEKNYLFIPSIVI